MSGYDYNPATAGAMVPKTYPSQGVVDQINAILNGTATGAAASGGAQQSSSSSAGGYTGTGISNMNPYAPQDAAAAQAQMNAINAAGPDVFDRAQGTVRDQRKAMLESIAGAGSAGKAEYQRQTAAMQARQSAALAEALVGAQARNVDPGTIESMNKIINVPYTNEQSDRDSANSNWQNLFSALGASYGKYYDQWGNTLPVMQQQFKNDLATNFSVNRSSALADIEKGRQSTDLQMAQIQLAARQRAEDQAIAAQQEAERQREWQSTFDENKSEWQKQFDEDARRYGLDYALKQQQLRQSGSSGGGGGGFGGTGMTQTQFKAAVPGAIQQMRSAIDPNNITGSTLGKIVGIDKGMNQLAGHNIALQNNISDALMASAMPKYSSGLHNVTPTAPIPQMNAIKAKFTPAQQAVFNGAKSDALNGLRSGFSANDVFNALDGERQVRPVAGRADRHPDRDPRSAAPGRRVQRRGQRAPQGPGRLLADGAPLGPSPLSADHSAPELGHESVALGAGRRGPDGDDDPGRQLAAVGGGREAEGEEEGRPEGRPDPSAQPARRVPASRRPRDAEADRPDARDDQPGPRDGGPAEPPRRLRDGQAQPSRRRGRATLRRGCRRRRAGRCTRSVGPSRA